MSSRLAKYPLLTTSWDNVTGKPSVFPPDTHSHAISDVTNLQTSLDAKAALAGANFSGLVAFQDHTIFSNVSGKGQKLGTYASSAFGWRDIVGDVTPKTTGVGAPTLDTIRDNVRGFRYSVGDDGDFFFHIPHDYVPGSDLYLHIHWCHIGTAISGFFTLDHSITYAKGHNQQNFGAAIAPTITYNTVDIATTPQYRHRIDEIQLSASSPSGTQLDSDDIEVDGLILGHYDVSAIPTITGAAGGANEPFILFIDLHYQSTNLPTKNKAPNFWS